MLKNVNWKTLLRILISLALLGWLIVSIDWKGVSAAILYADYTWFLAAAAWVILSMVVSVSKWRLVLEAQEIKISRYELWRAYWAGLFFNNFLPSSIGGDALRIFWVGKLTGDTAGSTSSVVVERIIATAGLALVGLAGSFLIIGPDRRIQILFLALLVGSLLLLALMMWGRLPVGLAAKSNRFIDFIKGMVNHGARLRGKPGKMGMVLFLSVIFQITVVGVNLAIFKALGINQLNLADLVYVIPATSVAAMLPLGINGYGVRESAYVVLLGAYGVNQGIAFAASVLFAFLISIMSLYGGWIWMRKQVE
ncbi:MAG: lysylphosphatidylglycerol synthase transmembrane domain-containing protein, partial [Syntrophomonadaceae bacterium]|nr:lysylphosphatidylglycerol synthase transmembrane domain-containing protein [Syntrophomonadaceae bacterium]